MRIEEIPVPRPVADALYRAAIAYREIVRTELGLLAQASEADDVLAAYLDSRARLAKEAAEQDARRTTRTEARPNMAT